MTEPTRAPGQRKRAIAWSTWALVAVVTLLIAAVGLSLYRYFTSEVEAQRFTPSAERITDDISMPTGTDPAIVTVTIREIDEEEQVARIDVVTLRACPPDTCDPFSLMLYGMPNTRDSWTNGRSVIVEVPAGRGPFDATIDLPIDGHPEFFPFDDYQLHLGVSVSEEDARGVPLPMTREEIEARGVRVILAELIPTHETRAVEVVPMEDQRPELQALEFDYALRMTFDRPDYVEVQTMVMLFAAVLTVLITIMRKSFDQLLVGTTGIILGIWGMRSYLIQTDYQGLTLIGMLVAIFGGIGLVLVITRIALYLSRKQQRADEPDGA